MGFDRSLHDPPPPARPPHRPWIPAALSAVLPGAGQWYVGKRRLGAALMFGSAALVTAAVWLYLSDPVRVIKLAFDTDVLAALFVGNIVVFGFRAWAVVDAYRSTEKPFVTGWAGGVVLTLVAVVLVVPHVWFGYYDTVQYDLITEVFVTGDTTTSSTTSSLGTTSTSLVPTSSTATSSSSTASTSSVATTTSTVATTTTTVAPPVWDGVDRLNVLLLGGDSGVGRTGVRTDTMILASIDPETGELALFSIPRNFARVPLPSGVDIWECDCFPPILNELYQYGEAHPESFPGPSTPGANAIKGAVGEMLGLDVHFHALVALQGFVDLVDALGGVTITVTERVYDDAYPSEDGGTEVIDFRPGEYEMDGHDALAYARSRRGSDDYNRMGRQRCVIEAVIDQADPISLLTGFPRIAEVLKESLATDIPLDAVPDLIELAAGVDTEEAISVRLVPPTYISGRTADGYNIPNVDLIREHARIATTLPPAEAMSLLGIDPLADECE